LFVFFLGIDWMWWWLDRFEWRYWCGWADSSFKWSYWKSGFVVGPERYHQVIYHFVYFFGYWIVMMLICTEALLKHLKPALFFLKSWYVQFSNTWTSYFFSPTHTGTIYKTTIVPSRTFCVVSYVPNPSRGLLFCVGVLTLDVFFFQVSVGQSEAKVYKLNFACIFELSTMSIHTCHNFEH